jgi:hypothetical protein
MPLQNGPAVGDFPVKSSGYGRRYLYIVRLSVLFPSQEDVSDTGPWTRQETVHIR